MHVDNELLFLYRGRRNGADLLIASEDGHEVQAGTAGSFSGRFRN